MSSKAAYSPGPSYEHLLGSQISIAFESGAIRRGKLLRQLRGAVRGDSLLVSLAEPIVSPQGLSFSHVAISTRAGGDLLTASGRPTVVNISVPKTPESISIEIADASEFHPATEATVTIFS